MGCQTTANMRLGQRAERQGRYDQAYRYYCDEAKDRPSRGTVQAAIARVAPRAAQSYEQQAADAADAGRYADAWRLYMQALAITPDNTAVARLIKLLEEQHPEAIASAKTEWMRQGDRTLAVADADSRRPDQPVPTPTRAGRSTGRTAPPSETAEGSRRRAPEAVQPPTASPAAPPTEEAEAPTAPPIETPKAVTAPPEGSYLTTVILSGKDPRFPKKKQTVDDLHVTLKDTDNHPLDADFDIYLGTTRIAKARNVAPGEGVRVRGRSGKWYDVVVITVVDRTESVRLGIRPYTGPRD